jgi:hypothetical protein
LFIFTPAFPHGEAAGGLHACFANP